MQFSFEPLTAGYKPLLLAWFELPHVQQFYYGDGLQNTLVNVDLFCRGIHNNGRYDFHHWLVFADTIPFAFLMTSPVTGPYDANDDYNRWYQIGKRIFTLDMLIGDVNYLGRGLAAPMIERFIHSQYADADLFLIDPECANQRAIHVYKKAGFDPLCEFVPDYNPKPHLMMRKFI